MRKQRELRLWKAYWVSRQGIPGPYHLIEGYEYGEVLKDARQRCRLADFPDVWTVYITDTRRYYDAKRGKWLWTPNEWELYKKTYKSKLN